MMSDEPRDDWTERMATGYHDPPPTPREEMWTTISARLGEVDEAGPMESDRWDRARTIEGGRSRRFRLPKAVLWGTLAASIALAMGIGIGRTWDSVPSGPTAAGAGGTMANADDAPSPARFAAYRHLSRTGSLLAGMTEAPRSGGGELRDWGSELLTQTRILLDSPAVEDSVVRGLLEDLELILIQVSVVDGADDAELDEELDFIVEGLENRSVLARIEQAVPEGYPTRIVERE